MSWFSNEKPDVVSIRYIELTVALYALLSGLIWSIAPEALSAPVYDVWRGFGIRNWGIVMLATGGCHLGALWLNGKRQFLSRLFRLVACALHINTTLTFGLYFLSAGAAWGSVLFWFMFPMLLIPVLNRLQGEIKWLRGN